MMGQTAEMTRRCSGVTAAGSGTSASASTGCRRPDSIRRLRTNTAMTSTTMPMAAPMRNDGSAASAGVLPATRTTL